MPPGPPVLASLVAEVYGQPDHSYDDLLAAAGTVADSGCGPSRASPTSTTRSRPPARKLVFVTDQEKAALNGVSVDEIARTLQARPGRRPASGTVRLAGERNPLRDRAAAAPRRSRSSSRRPGGDPRQGPHRPVHAALPSWAGGRRPASTRRSTTRTSSAWPTSSPRPLGRTAGRVRRGRDLRPHGPTAPRAERPASATAGSPTRSPGRSAERTFFRNGGGIAWAVPAGIRVGFTGEGEWKITLDVFRDLGLAFGAAMMMIYVLLVAQTGSFVVPLVVMLAIPLTMLGVMPGFWLLNALNGQVVGGYPDPVYFTATAHDRHDRPGGHRDPRLDHPGRLHPPVAGPQGRSLFDAIMESRVVRLRPILLTAGAAMLSSMPITLDPIFSGLAWSLIFGLFASTIFTLFVIPVTYWLLYAGRTNGKPPGETNS